MSLVSCETDLNIFSDRKEIIVVYGILDQSDSVHYIKINKAIPGSENAINYAVIEDSSDFDDNLEVKLIEKRNGSLRDIFFDTTSIYNKEPGLFYYLRQLLYESKEHLNQDCVYDLNIVDKAGGVTVSASTPLIHDFIIENPESGHAGFEFRRKITSDQKFMWMSAINGFSYQIIVRFYYKESSFPGDTLLKSVEWHQDIVKSSDASLEQVLTSTYNNERFFSTCINYIPYADPDKEAKVNARLACRFDFIFTVIGVDFENYLEFNQPLVGVIQGKPEYSNIQNGIGLLSCRFSKSVTRRIGQFTERDLINISNLRFIKNPDNY
jgi:hypothetical protein